MKRRIFTALLIRGLCVGTASAQFGFGGAVQGRQEPPRGDLQFSKRNTSKVG